MYKDDLSAALYRAVEAERRAIEAEEKLNKKEPKQKKHKQKKPVAEVGCLLRNLKWIWYNINVILGIAVFLLVVCLIRTACVHEKKENIYEQCIKNYCHKECKKTSILVTSNYEWVYHDSIISCSCYLHEGTKVFNLHVPKQCKKIMGE